MLSLLKSIFRMQTHWELSYRWQRVSFRKEGERTMAFLDIIQFNLFRNMDKHIGLRYIQCYIDSAEYTLPLY